MSGFLAVFLELSEVTVVPGRFASAESLLSGGTFTVAEGADDMNPGGILLCPLGSKDVSS